MHLKGWELVTGEGEGTIKEWRDGEGGGEFNEGRVGVGG